MESTTDYRWRVGDVFTDGTYRWEVESLHEGDTAVLRSCSTSWASTRRLTYPEWHEGHRWTLEQPAEGVSV